jgi:predicted DNA-binding ribbon-helix-helix protein
MKPIKRSFSIAGHQTSISLEEPFWAALREAAAREGVPLARLIARIDRSRGEANLSSAVRVWLLAWARDQSGVTTPIQPPDGEAPGGT